MAHDAYFRWKTKVHPSPLYSCSQCKPRLRLYRWITFALAAVYVILAAVVAVKHPYWGSACWWKENCPRLRFITSITDITDYLPALIAGAFAILPPLFFAWEYFWHDRHMREANDTRYEPEDKAYLERTKTFQDNVGKLWIGIAAAIAFLYVGEMAKKEDAVCKTPATSGRTITCAKSGASVYTCNVK
jgi:hypothetical protein